MQVPEVRLFMADDTIAYAVVKGPSGWYGMPGLRKGQFLTDEDVRDAIPLQPGPSVLVEIEFSHGDHAEGFADDRYDVNVNGQPGARGVPVMTAGTFIMSAAVQKADEPIMVIATRKTANVVELASRSNRKG